MAELNLETRDGGEGITYLDLQGDFDADSAPRVQQALEAACESSQPIVFVHMAEMNYIDSAGLGVLVGALKQVSAQGGQIVLVEPSPFVSRILRVTALDKVFKVAADAGQARVLAGLGAQ